MIVEPQSKRGDHLVAIWDSPPASPGELEPRQLLLLCHMDTVFEKGWLIDHPLRLVNDAPGGARLYGPGVVDMKAGICLVLSVMQVFRDAGIHPRHRLVALFTSDEEVGSKSSRSLIETYASQSDLVLCLEAGMPDNGLKTARKGTGEMVITAHGIASHAGVDHEKGRNAIEELCHHLLAVQKLTDASTGTTTSVGKVMGGGRTNVVPDYARAVVDLRIPDQQEAQRIKTWAQSIQPVLDGARVEAEVWFDRPPMPRDALMASTFSRAREIAAKLGIDLNEGSTGGGSDANFVAALGRPVLDGLGAVGGGAHSENEYLLVDSLAQRAALLAALMMEW